MPRLILLSDTHTHHAKLDIPDGDILIHAGDATGRGTIPEIARFASWFAQQPHRYKVFVAGNHDFGFERDAGGAESMLGSKVIYLRDRLVEIMGLRIYGSPYSPRFFDWAFNLDRGPTIRRKWKQIPTGVDVLITHGPPYGILDQTQEGDVVGCEDLLDEVVNRVKPRLHVFGHIHEGYGVAEKHGIKFVNASICTRAYEPTNRPIVVDL